jgi:hypothetical protein
MVAIYGLSIMIVTWRSCGMKITLCGMRRGKMSNTRKQQQKKKDRERAVRKKILARREKIRAEAKERRKLDLEEHESRTRLRPINKEEWAMAQKLHELQVKMQLEHNMEILKGLEQEYMAELKKRNEYLEQLRREGQSEKLQELEEGLPTESTQDEASIEDAPSLTEQAQARMKAILEKHRAGSRRNA